MKGKTISQIRIRIRMLVITLMVVFATRSKYSNAMTLDCNFGMISFSTSDSIYSCIASVLYVENDNVSAVIGSHLNGKRNVDVQGLRIYSRSIDTFPSNIEFFFSNIKVLNLGDNLISHINNGHLSPFPNLEYLSLWHNRITSLDSNLFSGLESMQYIDFEFNNILHVGHDFILPNSGQINFYGNPCISKIASTEDEIFYLRFLLLVNCPPTILQIEDTLESRPNLLTNVYDQVQSLERKNWQLESNVAVLTSRLALLEAIIEGELGLKKTIHENM